jgi:putative oxidoreductase
MPNNSQTNSRGKTITLWTVQILLRAMFIAAGGAKLASVPAMVELFDHIGFGQWFRYVTGIVEVTGGILLLMPRTAPFGAMLMIPTMACAVCTHLLLIGGNPLPATVLVILSAVILWLRRQQVSGLFGRVTASA